MKLQLISALALALAFGQVATSSAFAEEAQASASHFRSVAPQNFSTQDLQRYGLSAADAGKVSDLQAQGYQVRVVSPEQAQHYRAGAWGTHTWLIVGAIVVVVALAVAAND